MGGPARAFRVAHAVWGVAGLAALADIWLAVLSGRRDRRLAASVAFLGVEGVALLIGRGDCPMGPFQRRLGDPVPLFELVLPPRAAKLAVPVLAGLSVAGMAALLVPRRGRGRRPGRPPSLAYGLGRGEVPSMVMGTFLDHLEDAAKERQALEQRERQERAETRADYLKRTASRGPARVLRSSSMAPAVKPKDPHDP